MLPPLAVLLMVRVNVCKLKLAVTFLSAFIVVAHDPVPAQSPDQPSNTLPVSAVAVSETAVLTDRSAAQVEPQSTPLPDTKPEPLPCLSTVNI
jgi:hypothetical protein